MNKLIVGLIFALAVLPCQGGTITVDDNGPANFARIQDAIDASWDGDTIVVKPGTYNESISFNGRAITLTSEDPDDPSIVQSTVIKSNSDYSVTFKWNEGSDSVLTGFTITGRGIYCNHTSPTISKNVIKNCTNQGIFGQNNAAPTISGNTITANSEPGIYWCDGPIQDNSISQNGAGIAYCNGTIANNVISENSNTKQGFGGGLYYCDGNVIGNVITGNYAAFMGGGLYGCDGQIVGNVIAGNKAALAGGGLSNCNLSVRNNTIVGNRAGEDGGGLHSCTSLIRNNIIAFNRAGYAGGIHGPSKNSYNNFWANAGGNLGGGATVGPGDVIVDPSFAVQGYWDNNATPQESDDFWVDGDYHLQSQIGRWDAHSQIWTVDNVTSRCIDAGDPDSDWTAELWPHGKRTNMGAYGGTPQASMSLSEAGNIADLNHDSLVDYSDLRLFTDKWPCQQVLLAEDLSRDARVNFRDFSILAGRWGAEPPPPTPPLPNPMTWATTPYPTSPYSVAMVATMATSTDGSGVEYYFEDYYHPVTNSGWISFPPGEQAKWEVTGLSPQTLYWYRVRARNRGNLQTTSWSDRFGATTPREDTVPPSPNPATWQTEPHATSATSIQMTATAAVDDSGVEYQFECASHPAYSSNWQDSPIYQVEFLSKDLYTFLVRARDKSPKQNTTLPSTAVTVDLKPPQPDPMKWQVEPHETYGGGGTFDYYTAMTAAEATDESGTVQYYFQCTTESGFSSTWQSSRTYTVKVGRRNQNHRFRVKARDLYGNETGWSAIVPSVP
jgi:parallel beta-helix repeat protein